MERNGDFFGGCVNSMAEGGLCGVLRLGKLLDKYKSLPSRRMLSIST